MEKIYEFENKYCLYNKKCVVCINESQDNPNKLYYYCKYDEFGYFRFWMPNDGDFERNIKSIQQQISEVHAKLRRITRNNDPTM